MSYNDVFGGANIYPSEINYSAITLTADVTLSWPEETSASENLATKIINVSAATPGFVITLPAANKTGTGNTILFSAVGAASFIVKGSTGTTIMTVTSGTSWQVYLTNNATAAGVWSSLQYGASVSFANAAALAGTGIVAVGAVLSQSVPITTFNTNYTAGTADRAKMFVWSGAAGTLTLPAAATVGDNWFCYLRNAGSGAVVADPTGSPTIDGASTLSYQPGESSIIATDGANWYTIGFGQSATFVFDYTVIAVAGTGDYALTGTELNRIAYKFTGILTGNRNIIVPATVQQYWVDNSTTGAFVFTVKTAAGTGVAISSAQRGIFYCDGTDVVDADTSTVSTPIAIAQGGTGAITASAARINLGATSIGDAVYTAATTAAAYAALGAIPTVAGGTF